MTRCRCPTAASNVGLDARLRVVVVSNEIVIELSDVKCFHKVGLSTKSGWSGSHNVDDAKKSLASTSIVHFLNDGMNGVIPLMYPVYNALYSISLQSISVFTALQNVMSIVVSPYVGNKADSSRNFGWMMMLGVLLLSFGAAGYAVSVLFLGGSPLVIVLVLLSIVIGVGSSFYHPIGAAVLGQKLESS